ncbi:hypothetical protein [Kitasatospora sp. NPDC008115]|uniref:hypothetical protein n=1 Tax=Kitasatospora sp. NPDC008115 TaxID=3364022 RepID=UPI0036E498BC
MRTRLLAATLTALATVSLAACSSSGSDPGTIAAGSTTAADSNTSGTNASGAPPATAAATPTAPATTPPGTAPAPPPGAPDTPGPGTTAGPSPGTPTGGPAPTTANPPTPGTTGTAPAADSPADPPAAPKPAPPTDAGLPAEPASDLTARLVAALDAIDPAIVGGQPERAVGRAREQCRSMYQFPKDRAKLADLVNQRFTDPAHPQGFGAEKAEKILDALRTTLCPPA